MTFGPWRWWDCQPQAPAAFTHRKCSRYSFSLGAESTPGSWYGRKEYVTESGIDPGTVKLVAQRLKHYVAAASCKPEHITLSSTPDQQLENHSTKYHRQNHCIILLNSWWWAWWCPKHVEQAIRSAIKTSVSSSWHFISTTENILTNCETVSFSRRILLQAVWFVTYLEKTPLIWTANQAYNRQEHICNLCAANSWTHSLPASPLVLFAARWPPHPDVIWWI